MNAKKHKRKIYTSIYQRYWWKWMKLSFIGEAQYGADIDDFAQRILNEISNVDADHLDKDEFIKEVSGYVRDLGEKLVVETSFIDR